MVFTPENRKKLDNVTVVQYRGRHRAFEIIAVPNRLYEYKRNPEMSLDEVLQTRSIFADTSRGELAKAEDVSREFGADRESALRKILEQGSERKDKETREYELEVTGKAILEGVVARVRAPDRAKLTAAQAEELLRKLAYVQNKKPPKAQVADITKRAVKLGYTRRTVRMRAHGALDLSTIELPEGSHYTVRGGAIEATDDLYGAIHRLAERAQVRVEDLPEESEEVIDL